MMTKKLNNQGQGLTEYLMLLFLISVISIGVTKALGALIKHKLEVAKNHISKELVLEDKN